MLHNPAHDWVGSNSELGHFASDRFMLRMKRCLAYTSGVDTGSIAKNDRLYRF